MLTLLPRQGTDVPMNSSRATALGENRAAGILLWQLVATLAMGLGGLVLGAPIALSALLGGGVSTLASVVLAYGMFRPYRAQVPVALVLRIYGAEGLKLLLTLVLFVLVFLMVTPLSLPALFGAYLVVQILPTLTAPVTGSLR